MYGRMDRGEISSMRAEIYPVLRAFLTIKGQFLCASNQFQIFSIKNNVIFIRKSSNDSNPFAQGSRWMDRIVVEQSRFSENENIVRN